MTNNYAYPLDPSWSTDEITAVLHFLTQVEKAYETQVTADQVLLAYQDFKQVVPAKAQEKQIDRDFEEVSGYSSYRVVQQAKANGKGMIKFGK